ncbi:hypothetical protein GOV12_01305 [Candidatus Pacearchaeota archaeon]|nr:hypothetical protein [Candidatus Pacearchaeota archaeon]
MNSNKKINKNMNDLDYYRGRLEKVRLTKRITKNISLGFINDNRVYVFNGPEYVNDECLIRFDFDIKTKRKLPLGNFITHNIPEDFLGLSHEEYILFALWTNDMEKREIAPTIEEIRQYYNPGKLTSFYFFSKDFTNRHGRFQVTSEKVSPHHNTLPKILRNLSNHEYTVRLIVTESINQLQDIDSAIGLEGLAAIRMEPAYE